MNKGNKQMKPLNLSKDLGDHGDQIPKKPIYIYHIEGVKVGSAYNVKRRSMEQGYDLEDVEILYQIIPNTMTFNHIWRTEQFEARMRGYKDEHDGNRIAVNRVRASGGINRSRQYVLTNTETGEEHFLDDAAGFEEKHELTQAIICRSANPKQARQKFVTINGVKFTSRYAD